VTSSPPAAPRAEQGRLSAVVVAVDAEGGDNAPAAIVDGALTAAAEGIGVILTGRETVLRELIGDRSGAGNVEVVHAPEVIGFHDEPARAVRDHPDSSLVVAARLVAEGRAQALFSAGNSGAILAAGLLTIKRMRGIQRPAIAVVLPAVPSPVVLLDAGANAEVRAEHLRQFALLGQAFAREVLGVAKPTVGLLSIGEESSKGTPLVIEAHGLLAEDPRIEFYGNVEGRDLLVHKADVVVTDGFTGNVALKTSEGAGKALMMMLREAATSSARAKAGGLLLKPALAGVRAALDPEMYGGAHLLGMARPVVVGHGSTGSTGAANAVRFAARAAAGDLLAVIEAQLAAPAADGIPSASPSAAGRS
jgi:phosphate acyltransferase